MTNKKECNIHKHIKVYPSRIGPSLICQDCDKVLDQEDFDDFEHFIRSVFTWPRQPKWDE